MQYESLNVPALQSALNLLLGPQGTEVVAKMYFAFNGAMENAAQEGFRKGFQAAEAVAKEDAEQNIEERIDAAFDNGFMQGSAQAEEDADDAYIRGVADARARPAEADDNVQDIISERGAYAINGEYDASLVTDSGDETDDCPSCGGPCTLLED